MTELTPTELYYAGKTYYDLVRDFHSRFGHPVGDEEDPQPLTTKRQITRMEWIIEELVEFCAFDNLVNQVDAMLDCLYFVIGCFG